jgi:Flp pilus assembly protein TadG
VGLAQVSSIACRRARARFARSESGASMVEFAIILPILFLFLFGIIDFGRALFQYNNLTNAAREGARFAATRFPDPCDEPDRTSIKSLTAAKIIEFNNNAADTAYVRTNLVDVACTPGANGTVGQVTVTISNYPFQAVTPLPYLDGLTLGSATVPIRSAVRFEGASDAAP